MAKLQNDRGLQRLEVRACPILLAETVLRKVIAKHNTAIADVQFFGDRLDILTSNIEAAKQEIVDCLASERLKLYSLELD